MKTLFALLMFGMSSLAHAQGSCAYKTVVPDLQGFCSDWNFSDALRASNAISISAQLKANPALSGACTQEQNLGDWVTPLMVVVCNGDYAGMPAAVATLLANGDAQVNCDSNFAHTTALKCANNITDPALRASITQQLLKAGAVPAQYSF